MTSRVSRRAIGRGISRSRSSITTALALQAPIGTGGAAPRKPRPRISTKTSGSQDPRYGSARWRRLRNKVRSERPRCEGECGGFWPSKYADHVIEVSDDTSDANFFNETGIAALCSRCHGRKTARERARRAGLPAPRQGPVNCGVDPETGYPRSPQDPWR